MEKRASESENRWKNSSILLLDNLKNRIIIKLRQIKKQSVPAIIP